MFPKHTTKDLQWYKTEARRLNKDELYKLYTNTTDSTLYVDDEVAQIMLINQTDCVDVYFTSTADKEDTENNFDGDDEMSTEIYPLTKWVSNNSPNFASQLISKPETDKIESVEQDLETGRSLLKQVISKMETDDSERLIAISIVPDFYQDYNDDKENQKQANYFCRPIELQSEKENETLINKYSKLNKLNCSYQSERCTVQSAVDAILHAKMEYRGKNNVTLVGEDLRFILEI